MGRKCACPTVHCYLGLPHNSLQATGLLRQPLLVNSYAPHSCNSSFAAFQDKAVYCGSSIQSRVFARIQVAHTCVVLRIALAECWSSWQHGAHVHDLRASMLRSNAGPTSRDSTGLGCHAEERRMHCLHTCYAAAPPAAAGMFVENRRSLNLTATSAKKSQSNIELSWVSTYSWS